MLGVAAAAGLALVVAGRPPPAARPTAGSVAVAGPGMVEVPTCERRRLPVEGAEVVLLGPGRARLDERGGKPRVQLESGRLLVRTRAGQPLPVLLPGGAARIEPGTLAEVQVHAARWQVAAYEGRLTAVRESVEMPMAAGQQLSAGGPAPAPRGAADEARRLLAAVEVAGEASPAAACAAPPPGLAAANAPQAVSPAVAPPAPAPAPPVVLAPPVMRPRPRRAAPTAAPAPARASAPVPSADSPQTARLLDETRRLQAALHALWQERDPQAALRELDAYQAAHPHGALRAEADKARALAGDALKRP
jgi:hypothetical protein